MTGRGSSVRGREGEYGILDSISFDRGSVCIFHEGGDGHGTDTAGYRGNITAKRIPFVKFDVSFQGKSAFFAGIGNTGDADVDDDRAFFDQGSGDEFRFTQGRHNDIALEA